MINFPQLETNITEYCQNRCVGCNHIIPLVDKPAHLDPAVIERDLVTASKIMHSWDYSLVGGEPTMHPAIVDIIKIVKASEIADRVVMYSNGQSVRHLPDDFWRELGQLIITPYKLNDDDRAYITAKCAQFALPLEWHWVGFTRQFRRNPSPAESLFQSCWFRYNRSVIDNGYFYRCCTSPFIPFYLLGQAKEADGLALEGITEQKLRDYLKPAQPPEICQYCTGNTGPQIGWRETTRDKWLEESLG
jgi:GTP 3',8-cyclase